jgi:hypothetical protein
MFNRKLLSEQACEHLQIQFLKGKTGDDWKYWDEYYIQSLH